MWEVRRCVRRSCDTAAVVDWPRLNPQYLIKNTVRLNPESTGATEGGRWLCKRGKSILGSSQTCLSASGGPLLAAPQTLKKATSHITRCKSSLLSARTREDERVLRLSRSSECKKLDCAVTSYHLAVMWVQQSDRTRRRAAEHRRLHGGRHFQRLFFRSRLQRLSCPLSIRPLPSYAASPVWQLCNWTRLDASEHQKFCHMQHTDGSLCPSWLAKTHSRGGGLDTERSHPVLFPLWMVLLPQQSVCPAAGIPIFAFSQWSLLICHICCIPPRVAHCLPLPAPLSLWDLLSVWYFTGALLAKEASPLKYSAAFEHTSELWPANSWVPSAHCVSRVAGSLRFVVAGRGECLSQTAESTSFALRSRGGASGKNPGSP